MADVLDVVEYAAAQLPGPEKHVVLIGCACWGRGQRTELAGLGGATTSCLHLCWTANLADHAAPPLYALRIPLPPSSRTPSHHCHAGTAGAAASRRTRWRRRTSRPTWASRRRWGACPGCCRRKSTLQRSAAPATCRAWYSWETRCDDTRTSLAAVLCSRGPGCAATRTLLLCTAHSAHASLS